MKALRFHEYGGPEVLRLDDVPLPEPGAGEVRVRVAGSAFNPVDDGIRAGYLRETFPVELPHTPGVEVSGTIDALGEGVEGVAVGDAVIAFLPMLANGSAAEAVIAPAEVIAPAPSTVPLADAAALPMVALTAWQAIFEQGGLVEGQRILINGAGGAVGGYAIQFSKWAGATVIATASPRSAERVRAAARTRSSTTPRATSPRANPWTCSSTSRASVRTRSRRSRPRCVTAAWSSTRCRRSRRRPTRRAACAGPWCSSAATPSSSRRSRTSWTPAR